MSHKDALKAFLRLKERAGKEGFDIRLVSGFRNFEQQKKMFDVSASSLALLSPLSDELGIWEELRLKLAKSNCGVYLIVDVPRVISFSINLFWLLCTKREGIGRPYLIQEQHWPT